LHSVNPDGSVNWVIKHYGSYCYQNPTVAPDGTVYVVGEVGPELAGSSVKLPKASAIPGSNFLTAVHPDDGAMIWTYINTEREFDESPVVSPVGTILAMGENVLHALDDEGNFRWSFGPTGANYLLGVLPDGSAYIWNLQSESASTLYRINDSGDTMWRLDGYRIPMHLTVVDAVGNLLASNQDSDLVCLGPDGTERWTAQYDGEWISECFINGDGSLYLYTYDYMTYDHYLRIYPAD